MDELLRSLEDESTVLGVLSLGRLQLLLPDDSPLLVALSLLEQSLRNCLDRKLGGLHVCHDRRSNHNNAWSGLPSSQAPKQTERDHLRAPAPS